MDDGSPTDSYDTKDQLAELRIFVKQPRFEEVLANLSSLDDAARPSLGTYLTVMRANTSFRFSAGNIDWIRCLYTPTADSIYEADGMGGIVKRPDVAPKSIWAQIARSLHG